MYSKVLIPSVDMQSHTHTTPSPPNILGPSSYNGSALTYVSTSSSLLHTWVSLYVIVAKQMECVILVSEFKLQSHYTFYFWTNILRQLFVYFSYMKLDNCYFLEYSPNRPSFYTPNISADLTASLLLEFHVEHGNPHKTLNWTFFWFTGVDSYNSVDPNRLLL